MRHSVVVILRPSAQHARLACFDHEPSLHSALALVRVRVRGRGRDRDRDRDRDRVRVRVRDRVRIRIGFGFGFGFGLGLPLQLELRLLEGARLGEVAAHQVLPAHLARLLELAHAHLVAHDRAAHRPPVLLERSGLVVLVRVRVKVRVKVRVRVRARVRVREPEV